MAGCNLSKDKLKFIANDIGVKLLPFLRKEDLLKQLTVEDRLSRLTAEDKRKLRQLLEND